MIKPQPYCSVLFYTVCLTSLRFGYIKTLTQTLLDAVLVHEICANICSVVNNQYLFMLDLQYYEYIHTEMSDVCLFIIICMQKINKM